MVQVVTDLPHNTIRFPKAPLRLVREDCQGERGPYAVKLTEQLSLSKLGLDAGMTAAEVREYHAKQCEARIQAEARRLKDLRTPTQAAKFVTALAIKMSDEVMS